MHFGCWSQITSYKDTFKAHLYNLELFNSKGESLSHNSSVFRIASMYPPMESHFLGRSSSGALANRTVVLYPLTREPLWARQMSTAEAADL